MTAKPQSIDSVDNELGAKIREIANRIGSPYGEGATYEPDRPRTAKEEYGNGDPNQNLSHLVDDDWQTLQDDLAKLINQKVLEGRINELEHFYDVRAEDFISWPIEIVEVIVDWIDYRKTSLAQLNPNTDTLTKGETK